MTKNLEIDLLKSIKAKSRQEEISSYGKLISMRKSVTKNKKKYSRKMKHVRSQYDSYYFFTLSERFYSDLNLVGIMAKHILIMVLMVIAAIIFMNIAAFTWVKVLTVLGIVGTYMYKVYPGKDEIKKFLDSKLNKDKDKE